MLAATCIVAGFGSTLMGAFARYSIALAPGMGLNAYFAYTVVKGMGIPWQVALGAVFISGVTFLVLTAVGVRRLIVSAIPAELHAAVASGIGLFTALIGLRNAGIVTSSPNTLVTMGNLGSPQTLLAIFGLLLIAGLLAWKVQAPMLIGILSTTALGAAFGLIHWNPTWYSWAGVTSTAFRLDIPGALRTGALEIIFVFLFVDMFDNIGTLVGVGRRPACSPKRTKSHASIGFCLPTRQLPLPRHWRAHRPWSATSKARRAWSQAGEPAFRRLSPGCCSWWRCSPHRWRA